MSKFTNQELTGYSSQDSIFTYVKHRSKKYKLLRDNFVGKNLNIIIKTWIMFDFLWCILRYGSGINDYFQYDFFHKNSRGRKEFIVARKWHHIIKACNGSLTQEDFDDKSKFNSIFDSFLGRKWLDLETATYSEFLEFVSTCPTFIHKIKDGSGGNGIEMKSFTSMDLTDEYYNEHQGRSIILEEIIKQHLCFSKFNPSSVNSMRIVTMIKNGESHLVSAVFRCGNGEGITDNFHHLGLAALIDTETGIVYTPAIDKNNNKYIKHPISDEIITGFKIPNWTGLISRIHEISLVRKDVRYVGWDVVYTENEDFIIIEGNSASDPDITQIPDLIGKWPLYKKFI